jgi:hypothetical protein
LSVETNCNRKSKKEPHPGTASWDAATGFCSFHRIGVVRQFDLLALMAVLAQALLALVRSHFVALLFLSVWHD